MPPPTTIIQNVVMNFSADSINSRLSTRRSLLKWCSFLLKIKWNYTFSNFADVFDSTAYICVIFVFIILIIIFKGDHIAALFRYSYALMVCVARCKCCAISLNKFRIIFRIKWDCGCEMIGYWCSIVTWGWVCRLWLHIDNIMRIIWSALIGSNE